jgi:hypothetical protein
MSSNLKLDWCSYEAAKFAVEHWHYSRSMPAGKNITIGVWEGGAFIGAVVFGRGSGGQIGKPYGLAQTEVCELVRIALRAHLTPVSQIASIAIKMLRKNSPGVGLVVSFADPAHGHVGAIYQAMGWLFAGMTAPDYEYFTRGEWRHNRSVWRYNRPQWRHHRSATSLGTVSGLPRRPVPPKYRYLLPLTEEMRAKIARLAQPYPKRPSSIDGDAPCDQRGEPGSHPRDGLHARARRGLKRPEGRSDEAVE